MSNIEIIIEEVTVHMPDGRSSVFEIAYTDEREEQRAYTKGTSLYHDMDVFNRALLKSERIERKQIANMFKHPGSKVLGPKGRSV